MAATPCIHHEDQNGEYTCRLCNHQHCHACIHTKTGICYSCLSKGIVIILVIMVILSYIAWSALL